MPLNPTPYDALKKLLGASPDLNAADPGGMVQGRLGQENQAEEDVRRAENVLSAPRGTAVSGATPSTFHNLAATLGGSPNFGTEATKRADDFQSANDSALQAGFRGDQEIAGPASGGNQLGEHLYANVGNRSGDTPVQMAGASASRMNAMKVQAPILAAHEKAAGDLLMEREKGSQERQTNQSNWDRTEAYMHAGQAPPPTTPPLASSTPAPGAPPAAPNGQPRSVSSTSPSSPPAGPPQQSQGIMEYLTGTGPRAHNGLMDSLSAMAERAKYGYMSTPLAPLIQNESFGNLEQLQAQFPGVRGFSYLLPKLKEHQANFGKGETPDASYNRLHELVGIMGQVEQEMGDPRSHALPQPNGTLKFSQTPAAIQRAASAVKDTKMRFEKAMEQLKLQYPGLDAPISTQSPGAAGSSRFERVPE